MYTNSNAISCEFSSDPSNFVSQVGLAVDDIHGILNEAALKKLALQVSVFEIST